jgi:raffinose/stachyose/melibiose transport system permease protein
MKTLTSGLMYFAGKYTMQWDLILAGVTITSLPIILLYIILQKNIISGLSSGAIKN